MLLTRLTRNWTWSLYICFAPSSVKKSAWRSVSYRFWSGVHVALSVSPPASRGICCVRPGAVVDQSTYWSTPL